MLDVVHVSPSGFGVGGVFGGGERYPVELALAQSEHVACRLVTFGAERRRLRLGKLQIHVLPTRHQWRGSFLNPVSELLPAELASARVVHVHQYETALAAMSLWIGHKLRRRMVVTEHGGWAPALDRFVDRERLVRRHLAVSRYAAGLHPGLLDRTDVVYGGVDTARYAPAPVARRPVVLFVGRIMPHKGLHVLVEALPAGMRLEVHGTPYDEAYLAELHRLAAGKDVAFHHGSSDADIREAYRTARVLVLPSVGSSPYAPPSHKAELLGLTLLEAMACGAPVITSDTGGMPEVVVEGETGFVVPAGDVAALRARLEHVWAAEEREREAWSERAVARVRGTFTWEQVAARTLAGYER